MRHLIVVIGLFILGFQANGQLYMAQNGEVSFFSKTPLEDIDALNKQVGSIINADNNEVAVQMRVSSFVFPNKLMQEHFNENYLESDKYPRTSFKGVVPNFDLDKISPEGTFLKINGTIKIHGVSKPITVSGFFKKTKNQLNYFF